MNRRSLLKSVIGVAVATALPRMPFKWHELGFAPLSLTGFVRASEDVLKGHLLVIDGQFNAQLARRGQEFRRVAVADEDIRAGQIGAAIRGGMVNVRTVARA